MSWNFENLTKEERYQKAIEKSHENDAIALLIDDFHKDREEYDAQIENLKKQRDQRDAENKIFDQTRKEMINQFKEKKLECEKMKREWDLEKKQKEYEGLRLQDEIKKLRTENKNLREQQTSGNSKNCESELTKQETVAEESSELESLEQSAEVRYERGWRGHQIPDDLADFLEWEHFVAVDLRVDHEWDPLFSYTTETRTAEVEFYNFACRGIRLFLAKPPENLDIKPLKKLCDYFNITYNHKDDKDKLLQKLKTSFDDYGWKVREPNRPKRIDETNGAPWSFADFKKLHPRDFQTRYIQNL